MMRKHVLSMALALLSVSLTAQSPLQLQMQRWAERADMELSSDDVQQPYLGVSNPYVSTLVPPDVVIGQCRYDRQSNYSMQRRMHVYPDGTIGATWMRAMLDPGYTDRGTAYNYFNGSTWEQWPTARIETVRTGWPSYAPFGPNGEIVVAHTGNATGLVFNWRPNKGTGAWTSFTLTGPDNLELLYPRIVTNGPNRQTIHLIVQVRSTTPYQGLAGALVYSRSQNGGQSWDILHQVIEGIDATRFPGHGADRYAFAEPLGDTLAFVTGEGYTDVCVMKSFDNGNTWDRIDYYNSIDPFMNGTIAYPLHGSLDSYHNIVLDDLGRVHVSSGRRIHRTDGNGGRLYRRPSDGLIYWNETMPPLDTTILKHTDAPDGVPDNILLARVQDNGTDSIVGIATYYASLTSMPQLVFDRQTKFLYAFYSALTLGFVNNDYNYRHIWMRYSEDYGQTWSPPVDLTGDIFHLFTECVFPTASPTVNNKVHLIYQSDDAPGMSATDEHPVRDNNIVHLTVDRMTVGIKENKPAIVSVDQLFPNPARDVANLVIKTLKASSVSINIYNTTGQLMHSQIANLNYAGPHRVQIPLQGFDAGLYVVKVEAGTEKLMQKLVVR
ncbi:MAG TPA: T9SS type A sorting domain-containing protein [Bacteroidales bacterium]|nr:T9SS type A sorting domain-containing protein [Bacteroidales bacterium]